MSVTLLQGDCLELLPTLEAGSVDLILADLPYGTTACKWDSIIPLDRLWPQYKRVLKPRGAVVLTASQPFTTTLISSNLAWFRYTWVWEKSVGTGFLDANRKPLKCHEDICVFYGQTSTYNPQKQSAKLRTILRSDSAAQYGRHTRVPTSNNGETYPRSVLYFPKELGTLHPTQKPAALMEYLIRTYSNPGDTVLDNTMGSGTTGAACITTDRHFIGMERDPGYFQIATQRIAATQPPLLEAIA